TMRDLVPLNVLAEPEVEELERALDFLWRVRNGMHLLAQSHQDLLTFELQEQLAARFGFGEGPAGREAFMRAYHREATTASRVSEAVITRCVRSEPYRGRLTVRQIAEGMRIVRGELAITGRSLFERDPAALVDVFLQAQRHEVPLAESAQDAVRQTA